MGAAVLEGWTHLVTALSNDHRPRFGYAHAWLYIRYAIALSRGATVLFLLCISWWGKNQVDAAGELRQISSGGVVYAAAPQERGAYVVGGARGQSHYGYNTGDGQAKVEVRQPNGAVYGSYRYFDPNGEQVVRSYIADSNGFRVLGNDLPISPDTPAYQVQGVPAFTGASEGTTEFDIPPPLLPAPNNQRLIQPENLQSRSAAFIQNQHIELQELERQRNEIRIQQEKLEALQRKVEAQQRKVQQSSQSFQESSSASGSSSFQVHHPYYQRPNTQTGGLTSPYYYHDQHLNYDFPAGFAYSGLPVANIQLQPQPRGCYSGSTELGCGHNYIIGRAR
ncbi:hypothetical protein SK128_006825 [Halocaridina rubra]|uniref:Cuticle protein 6 n=1 Tax=Halocaridina rubra TaxID=373956 RepID=A0AAN8XKH2_HALRR